MLSLKATLKAIAESISTIKTALDGKATKYTGYGTPVTLTTSWYTFPSDGIIRFHGITDVAKQVSIRNADGSNQQTFMLYTTLTATYTSLAVPVIKGQQGRVSYQLYNTSNMSVTYIPFV